MAPTAALAPVYCAEARLRASCNLEDAMAEIDSNVPFVGAAVREEYCAEAALKAEPSLSLAAANDPE